MELTPQGAGSLSPFTTRGTDRQPTPDPLCRKAELLQRFLISKLQEGDQRKQLEKQTGYSKRYLDMLFQRYVGLSPKTLASVSRFQYFHRLWARNPAPGFYRDEVYKFYYDQAHFIREFKRFSGYTPEQYAITDNEFGRIFYKDR